MCEFFVGEVEWVCLECRVVNYVVWQLMWVVCSACWWQCGVVKNCSAWFVLVNVERSAFCSE